MGTDIVVLNLLPWLHLRKLLNLALAPVRPSPEFRARLRDQLMEEARRLALRSQRPAVHFMGNTIHLPGRREILIGAVVGSAVSLAGIIAILIRVIGAGRNSSATVA